MSRIRYRRSKIVYVLDGSVAVGVESRNYGKLSKKPSSVPPLKGRTPRPCHAEFSEKLLCMRLVSRVHDSGRLSAVTMDTITDLIFFYSGSRWCMESRHGSLPFVAGSSVWGDCFGHGATVAPSRCSLFNRRRMVLRSLSGLRRLRTSGEGVFRLRLTCRVIVCRTSFCRDVVFCW